jgi:hypothetical protein
MKYKDGNKEIEMSDYTFLELTKNKKAMSQIFAKKEEFQLFQKFYRWVSSLSVVVKFIEWFKFSSDSG